MENAEAAPILGYLLKRLQYHEEWIDKLKVTLEALASRLDAVDESLQELRGVQEALDDRQLALLRERLIREARMG